MQVEKFTPKVMLSPMKHFLFRCFILEVYLKVHNNFKGEFRVKRIIVGNIVNGSWGEW